MSILASNSFENVDVDLWFSRQAPATTPKYRLFCFPYAGGGASIYREWAKELNAPVEVVSALLPGREGRMGETPYSDIRELARELVAAIPPLLDMPFFFFGHSMGAKLAYTVCLELRRQGLPQPECMMVSAARPPHIPEPNPLYHLDNEAFIDALRRFAGTPEAILANEELMALFMPMLRADFALEEAYKHVLQLPLDIPVTAISGTDDQEVSPSEMAQWSEHSVQDVNQYRIDGGHFFINNQRLETLQIVQRILASHIPSMRL